MYNSPLVMILIGINFLVYLIEPSLASAFTDKLYLWSITGPDVVSTPYGPATLGDFHFWQLLTYGFFHGNFSHIFFNMFGLWMIGSALEQVFGPRRFLEYYLICIVGAGIIQELFWAVSGTWGLTVGASGGVFGILLAFGLLFPNRPIILLFFPVPLPAKYVVIGYGLLELWTGISGTQTGVAHFAHLGGMLFGYLLIRYWRKKGTLLPTRKR